MNHTPADTAPATGNHDPKTCPPRHDGYGDARPCSWYDHDDTLFVEGARDWTPEEKKRLGK